MAHFTQADQVKVYAGQNLAGAAQYTDVQAFMANELLVPSLSLVGFTLAADATSYVGTVNPGAQLIYTDASSKKSTNGAIAASTALTTLLNVGGRVANVVRVLDANDDGVLDEYGKDVFAIISTDGADGDVFSAAETTLEFVVRDDATDGYTAYELLADDYQLETLEVYTVGSATVANVYGRALAGMGGIDAQSYEEIVNLLENRTAHQVVLGINAHTTLPADKLVKVKIASGVITFVDSADVTISGITTNTTGIKYPATVVTGTVGSAYAEGVKASFGGIDLPFSSINITAAEEVTLDLTGIIGGVTLYEDTSIILEWK